MPPVLVTGATGKQGGATVRALLARGVPVRALVRDPAKANETPGVEWVVGDLGDRDSLRRAAQGASAVFSVQMAPVTADGFDFDAEVAQGVNLIDAAKEAGVAQFVHSSVTGAGQHADHPQWRAADWPTLSRSMAAKTAIQDHLRAAGFPRWTLLKPGFFMENFTPSARFLFPRGIEGGLVSMLKPHTRLALVSVVDIGEAAAAAIADPDRFHKVELELASDHLSMTEIAAVLSRVFGTPLPAPDMDKDEAFAAGMPPMGADHDWFNTADLPARPEFARELGIPLTSFESWARANLT